MTEIKEITIINFENINQIDEDHPSKERLINELKLRVKYKTSNEDWTRYKNTNYWVARSGGVVYREEDFDKRIYSDEYGELLPQYMGNDGLVYVKYGSDVRQYVHRMVAETFKPIDNMEEYQIHHINNNSYHNTPENLIWLTEDQHAPMPK